MEEITCLTSSALLRRRLRSAATPQEESELRVREEPIATPSPLTALTAIELLYSISFLYGENLSISPLILGETVKLREEFFEGGEFVHAISSMWKEKLEGKYWNLFKRKSGAL